MGKTWARRDALRLSSGKCRTGKVRYPSENAAEDTLDMIMDLNLTKHSEQRSYPCPTCSGWHLTSMGQR